MSHAYKVEATKALAQSIIAAGFRVFIAKDGQGTYGLFTDAEGSKVVSFQYDLGGFKFSGNYKARKAVDAKYIGTGWMFEDGVSFSQMFLAYAPRWATSGLGADFTTLEQHLATYSASNFAEVFAE